MPLCTCPYLLSILLKLEVLCPCPNRDQNRAEEKNGKKRENDDEENKNIKIINENKDTNEK